MEKAHFQGVLEGPLTGVTPELLDVSADQRPGQSARQLAEDVLCRKLVEKQLR